MRRDTYKKEIEQLKLNKDSEDLSLEELTKQAEQTLSEKTEEFYRNEVNYYLVIRFNFECLLKKYVNNWIHLLFFELNIVNFFLDFNLYGLSLRHSLNQRFLINGMSVENVPFYFLKYLLDWKW